MKQDWIRTSEKKGYRDKCVGVQYLRAVCAIMVFLSHYVKGTNNGVINAFSMSRWSFVVDGSIAVAVFFVLSGFFYYNTKTFDINEYLKGIRRKALHIYPAHILILLIGWLLASYHINWNFENFTEWGNKFWTADIGGIDFIKNASCVLIKDAANQINPSAWYLEYEVWLFLIMPFIVGFINKIGWKWSWSLLILGVLALLLDLDMYNLLYIVAVCCIGVLARYLTQLYKLKFLQNIKWLTIWLFVAILLMAHVYFGAGKIFMFVRGIGAAMIVVAFWKYNFHHTKKLGWLVFLGNISFEFYIVQHVALLALRPCFVNPIIYFMLSLIVTVFVAWLINRYVTAKTISIFVK